MNIELDKVVCHFKTKFPEIRIVRGMLVDIFPKEQAEINLAVMVYSSGYVEKLVTMPDCKKSNFDAAVSSIVNETFLAEAPVKEVLKMWLNAYNELELKKQAEVKPPFVQANPEEALKWLRKAAELGNQEAMLKLGNLLYKDKRSLGEIINEYEARITQAENIIVANKTKLQQLADQQKNSENSYKVQLADVYKKLTQWQSAYYELENKYKKQIKQISEKEYTDGYNDAAGGKCNKYVKEKPIVYQNVKIGDVIKFGSYPQNYRDKKEPIEWRVLDIMDGKALLISQYGLDGKRYNERLEATTWEKCTLRRWLNDDFLNSAFSNVEKNTILLSSVTADKNPKHSTYQGIGAKDKVFLLSVKEAEQYFKSDVDRKCFAVDNIAYKYGGQCWWWLRSLGGDSNFATRVNPVGSVNYCGYHVNCNDIAVRPALWINLKS